MKRVLSVTLVIFLAACGGSEKDRGKKGLALKSPAFQYGWKIPAKYTCDGANVSPELVWSGVPAGAKSLVLICEDISGVSSAFIHWAVYNIPPTSAGLPQNVPPKAQLSDGSRQAYNTYSLLGYMGPCPGNETHQYVFNLYALDISFEDEPPLNAGKVIFLLEGHVIARSRYLGTYR